jgi:spermidine/putrescine transport system substrate-binding protein
MSSSKQKALAKAFINFLNEPNNAARLAQFAYYATPNLAAEKLLPEDFLSNPYIYPPAKVLAKSEIYQPLPGEILRIRNRILNRVIQR